MANINIAFAFDSRVLKIFYVALASLLKNRGACHYDVYIVTPASVTEDEKKGISEFARGMDKSSRVVFLDPPDLSEILSDELLRFGEGAWWRIGLYKILPESVKSVIYMDHDVIVRGALDELASLDFGGAYVAVKMGQTLERKGSVGFDKYIRELWKNGETFNSGVMVFNLDAWRERDLYKEFVPLKDLDLLSDQERLNIVCRGKTLALDPEKYNITVNKTSAQNVIWHYPGDVKPWDFANQSLDKTRGWWEYARLTPFYQDFKDDFERMNLYVMQKNSRVAAVVPPASVSYSVLGLPILRAKTFRDKTTFRVLGLPVFKIKRKR